MCADAGEQHAETEGLGHIIVSAGIEAQDGVRFRSLRGQHDDRTLVAVAAHDLAGFAAVEIGQVHVEENDVGVLGFERLDPLRCGGGVADAKFLVKRELLPQRLAQGFVVIDDQDLGFAAHGLCRSDPPVALS